MSKSKKIIISVLLIYNILILNTCKVYASSIPEAMGLGRLMWRVNNMSSFDDFLDLLNDGSFGLIPGSSFFNRQTLEEYYQQYMEDRGIENPTEQDMVDDIKNQITVSDNSVTIDNDLRQWIYNQYNNQAEDDQVYCYSYPILVNSNQFASIDQYQKAGNKMVSNRTDPGVYRAITPGSGYNYLAFYSFKDHPYYVFKGTSATSTDYGITADIYDGLTGTTNPLPDVLWRWEKLDPNVNEYDWVEQETIIRVTGNTHICLRPNYTKPYGINRGYGLWLTKPDSVQYRFFKYQSTITNDKILNQPYYINERVWQDFSQTTGDYVMTDENINTVSYGDVISYVDSFNETNGYPPTPININNYIEDQDDENKDSGGSGGSGSGGSGSGDDGDSSGILGNLGKVIGNLLKGIIAFITGILEGIVEGLTSLLESLTTLISDFVEAIPNVISPLIGWAFEGLPSEIQALIILGIGLGITISIIKIIRG